MIGIEERETPSGIHCLRLHYTADPHKRSPEWLKEAKRGMNDRSWRKEYEIDWTVASGLPVYSDDFVREWHVAKEPLTFNPNEPIIRGHDLGATHLLPAGCWCQADAMGRLNVLAEYVTWTGRGDMRAGSMPSYSENIIFMTNRMFDDAEMIDYCDPAGWTKSQTDEKSCVDILHANGIYPRQGAVTFTKRKEAIQGILRKASGGRAQILIDPRCSMIIEGFEGAYKYEQIGETGRYKPVVEKNAWSHVMNALEYVVAGVFVAGESSNDDEDYDRRRNADRVTGY
jgi:hypothetical protein